MNISEYDMIVGTHKTFFTDFSIFVASGQVMFMTFPLSALNFGIFYLW